MEARRMLAADISGMWLINADSNQPIAQLTDGMTIDYAALGTDNLNVRADANSETDSIRFDVNGATYRVENSAPYSLAGDRKGDFYAWTPAEGQLLIKATPYSGSGGNGTAGEAQTLRLNVVRGSAQQPPAAPSSLKGLAASSSQVKLTWVDGSSDESGFKIERSTNGSTWSQIATVGAGSTSYTADGLSASTAYQFRVRAYNGAGDSSWSNIASASTLAGNDGGTGLVSEDFATGAGNFTVIDGQWAVSGGTYQIMSASTASTAHLNNRAVHNTSVSGDFTATVDASVKAGRSWSDLALIFGYQDANNYYFFSSNQSNDGGTNGLFKVVNGVVTELADVGATIATGTTYELSVQRSGGQIRAYRDGVLVASATDSTFMAGKVGLGTKNDRATFDNLVVDGTAQPPTVNPPAAPSLLAATAASSSRIDLSWKDNATNESGYRIERSTNGTSWTQIGSVAAGSTSYGANGLSASTKYYFRVVAFNEAGNSGYSNTVSATTQSGGTSQPGERPGADNTGPTNESVLQNVGTIRTTRDGQIIENVSVTGTIEVLHNNVTIRNFRIAATGPYGIRATWDKTGIVVEDGEITGMSSAAVYGDGITLRRLNIHHGGSDGVKPDGSNFVMEDSWIHHLGMNDGAHADGVQARNAGTSDWTGLVFRGNYFDMPKNQTGFRSNALIYIQDESEASGRIIGAIIEGNWLNGGNYSVQFLGSQQMNHVVTDNRFGRDNEWGILRDQSQNLTWTNNVWDDTGAAAN